MKFDKNTKILIVGLGLIGGSYAKALSDNGYFVGAIDKKKSSVEYALKNGLIRVGETSVKKDFVKDFDLIVFAMYPHDFINWIKEYQSSIKSGALITDVTGVKSFVVENVQKILDYYRKSDNPKIKELIYEEYNRFAEAVNKIIKEEQKKGEN